MRQPLFSRLYHERAEQNVKDVVPTALTRLVGNIEDGDQRAIEFGLKMTGRYDPAAIEVQNARAVVVTMMEFIMEYADEEAQRKILGGHRGKMRTLSILATVSKGIPDGRNDANLGLYLPGGGSTGTWTPDEVADVDPLNQNFQKIDVFAGTVGVQTNRNQQFFGPAAAISSISGMKLGDEYQESDGNKTLWRYDGTNWVTAEVAAVPDSAHHVRRCTGTATGTVIPTPGGTEVTLDGIFTDRFKTLEIVTYGRRLLCRQHVYQLPPCWGESLHRQLRQPAPRWQGGTAMPSLVVAVFLFDMMVGSAQHHGGSVKFFNMRNVPMTSPKGRLGHTSQGVPTIYTT